MSARATTRDEDHEIIRRVGRGDHEAFRCLVDRYRGPLYGFVLRMVKRPAIAEELVQETFVRAYRAAPRFEPTASVSTWLFQIAARLAMNEAARAHHAREVMIDGPDVASNSAGPDAALESLELGRAIEEALDQLPLQQRAAAVLARYEEMSYREIGHVLDISESAVDGLLQRARRRLMTALRPWL